MIGSVTIYACSRISYFTVFLPGIEIPLSLERKLRVFCDMLLARRFNNGVYPITKHRNVNHARHAKNVIDAITQASVIIAVITKVTTLAKFPHLNGVKMHDNDEKPELPVHLILGASEYARIKTETKPKLGRPNEPVAELTRFGWTILSPGKEIDLTRMLSTQTASPDYEQLCRLDVLGLKDSATSDQEIVYEEFKEQLTRNPGGWYETSLPWKGNHPPLQNNKAGSLTRLHNLVRKLEKQDTLEQYDKIIRDQLEQGIVERVENDAKGK